MPSFILHSYCIHAVRIYSLEIILRLHSNTVKPIISILHQLVSFLINFIVCLFFTIRYFLLQQICFKDPYPFRENVTVYLSIIFFLCAFDFIKMFVLQHLIATCLILMPQFKKECRKLYRSFVLYQIEK